jgi:hypothetical protein
MRRMLKGTPSTHARMYPIFVEMKNQIVSTNTLLLPTSKERCDKEKHKCPNHGHDQVSQETIRRDAKEGKNVSSKKSTDHTYNDISKEAKATSLGEFTSNPAGEGSNNEKPQ